jgi:hypothetical protein
VSQADEIAPYPEDFSRRIEEAYLDVARRHTKTRRQGPRAGFAEAVVKSNKTSLGRRFESGFLMGEQDAKIFLLKFLQISLQIKN